MAFLKEGSADGEKGDWVQAGIDSDNGQPIELRIRAVPEAETRRIRESYGREDRVQEAVKIKQKDGSDRDDTTTYVRRIHSIEDFRCISRDHAEYALTDCKNLIVVATDEAKAKVYSALLGGTEVKPNEPTVLDGRLTKAFKHYLLENDSDLVAFVNVDADKKGERKYGKEARLGKT